MEHRDFMQKPTGPTLRSMFYENNADCLTTLLSSLMSKSKVDETFGAE